MKAQIGDYVRKDGGIVKVIGLDCDSGYLTEDGGCIADDELSLDDVLLESEVSVHIKGTR